MVYYQASILVKSVGRLQASLRVFAYSLWRVLSSHNSPSPSFIYYWLLLGVRTSLARQRRFYYLVDLSTFLEAAHKTFIKESWLIWLLRDLSYLHPWCISVGLCILRASFMIIGLSMRTNIVYLVVDLDNNRRRVTCVLVSQLSCNINMSLYRFSFPRDSYWLYII